jgi:hypothetical protein
MKRNQIAVFRLYVIPVPERLDIFDFLTFINGVGQLPKDVILIIHQRVEDEIVAAIFHP